MTTGVNIEQNQDLNTRCSFTSDMFAHPINHSAANFVGRFFYFNYNSNLIYKVVGFSSYDFDPLGFDLHLELTNIDESLKYRTTLISFLENYTEIFNAAILKKEQSK